MRYRNFESRACPADGVRTDVHFVGDMISFSRPVTWTRQPEGAELPDGNGQCLFTLPGFYDGDDGSRLRLLIVAAEIEYAPMYVPARSVNVDYVGPQAVSVARNVLRGLFADFGESLDWSNLTLAVPYPIPRGGPWPNLSNYGALPIHQSLANKNLNPDALALDQRPLWLAAHNRT